MINKVIKLDRINFMSRNLKEDYILNDLNLEPIIVKAMDAEEGKGWDLTKAKKISEEYRKYLILCLKYPKKSIVPSPLVDEFWHLHILDTQKYAIVNLFLVIFYIISRTLVCVAKRMLII